MNKYEIVKNINPNIFRGYDIRGIYGEDLYENVAYTIGRGYATYVKKKGYTKCVIGHDVRSSSPTLSDALISGIIESGMDVIDIGLTTTPMFYFAQIKLSERKNEILPGIMITASHNPKEHNGFKMSFDNFGNACGSMIVDFRNFISECNFDAGKGEVLHADVKKDYLELIKNSISLGDKKIKAVVDCANGTACILVKEIFEMFKDKIEMIPLYCDADPNFPNHHPDPSVEENNKDLKAEVIKNHADLGIGIDGDGDRVGIIDETGKMVFIDFYAIIIWRDIMSKVSNKHALFDVKCTKALSDEIEKLGGIPVCYRTGNSYMKAKMRDGDFAFGSELSGHVFFRDKWPNIDDGLYAGLRLIEILSRSDKTVSGLLEGVNVYYSTPEIKIKSSDDTKFGIIEKIKEYAYSKGYKVNDIDGMRAEFDNGWALVRASNTGPNITARFEGVTKEDMEKIEKEFMGFLKI